MQKIDNLAGILVYMGLAGVVIGLVVILAVTVLQSLIFGA